MSNNKLYEKYHDILTSYLKKKYPQKNDIEDDVSEILIKVFMSLETYDPERAAFKTWVFSIAKNYMIDCSRKHEILSGTLQLNSSGDSTTLYSSDGDESIMYISSNTVTHCADLDFEVTNTLNYVSDHLVSCDYTFLDMKYAQGYSYDEIGMEFNMNSVTVSNRVNYIKGKLKECIGDNIFSE